MILSWQRALQARGNQVWHWLGWLVTGERILVVGGVLIMGLLLGRTLGIFAWLNRPGAYISPETTKIEIGSQRLAVEVVSTPAAIQQGLSDRQEIGSDGMLFWFADTRQPTFWMFRMRFSLDMIGLHNGEIVQIVSDVPPPSETDGIPEVVEFTVPIEAVLEVPAGTARKHGWQVGTKWRPLDPLP